MDHARRQSRALGRVAPGARTVITSRREQLNPHTEKGRIAADQLSIHEQIRARAAEIRANTPDDDLGYDR